MPTFVLVPGAFHGGWCWKKVCPLLRAAACKVYTPTLTGVGERSHLLSREITLNTHIRDIVNVLEFEDLENVILVGHSYGAIVIHGVTEIIPERLSQLVSLDGDPASDGLSLLDSVEKNYPEWVRKFREIVSEEGEGWQIPFSDRIRQLMEPDNWKEETFGVTDKKDLTWMRNHLTAHPMSTFEDKLHLGRVDAASIPRTFIWCSVFEGKKIAERPSLPPNWNLIEIETGHDAMITAPLEVSEILLNLTRK